jgi:hypothetical protein
MWEMQGYSLLFKILSEVSLSLSFSLLFDDCWVGEGGNGKAVSWILCASKANGFQNLKENGQFGRGKANVEVFSWGQRF